MEKQVLDQHIPEKEKWMYGVAGLGQNIIYITMSAFLMFFLTDVYGINPIAAGTMMMITRIWDAVNDPIMGLLAERTRTRWGKLRPYILFSLLPIALFTVLNYLAPDFGDPTLKLVWCYVAYIGWEISYTMSDIPYWGLSAAMTSDTKERTDLLTRTRVLTMVGTIAAILVTPLFLKRMSKRKLFIYSSIVGVVTNIIMYIIGGIISGGTMKMEALSQIYICLGLLFLSSFTIGFFTILQTIMIGDTVDYLEWKTGVRAEGFAFQDRPL